jgi:hypothetical protein
MSIVTTLVERDKALRETAFFGNEEWFTELRRNQADWERLLARCVTEDERAYVLSTLANIHSKFAEAYTRQALDADARRPGVDKQGTT